MDAEKARYVIQHRADLTQNVSAVMPIIDSLGSRVHPEIYAEIQGQTTRQNQMRILYTKLLQPGGTAMCAAFYDALKQHQSFLLETHAVSRDVNIMDRVSFEQDSNLEPLEDRILAALMELTEKDYELFQWYLRKPQNLEGLQPIPMDRLEKANKMQTVDLILHTYTNKGEKIVVNILTRMKRNDLLLKFRSIP